MRHPTATFLAGALFLLAASALAGSAADDPFADLDKTGAGLMDQRDFAKAEDLYKGALAQAREKHDRTWEAEFLRRMGEVHERNQDLKGALPWYEQSLPIRRELGQKPEIAVLLFGTGKIKAYLADYSGGEVRLEEAVALSRELHDTLGEANATLLWAQICAARNDYDKADELYRAELVLQEKLHNPAAMVGMHAARAALFFQRAQYRNALQEGFAAIDGAGPVAKELPAGEARKTLLTNQANAMEVVGNTYQKMVQLARALDYYQQALRIRQDLQDLGRAASVWSNLAPLLISLGRIPEAVDGLQNALVTRRGLGNRINIASTLMGLGEAYLAQGKPEDARRSYEEALSLVTDGSTNQAVALYQLGNIALDAGKLDEALTDHQRALAIREKARNPHDVVRSRIQIARVHERRGELAEAETAYTQAIDGFEKLLLEVADPIQLAAFRETAARLYPNYARLLFGQNKFSDALLVAERSRGQALARLYGTGSTGFLAQLSPPERARWDQATAALARAANRFRIAIEEGAADRVREQAQAAWLDAKAEISRTRERLFADNPSLQSGRAPVQPELAALAAFSRSNSRTLYFEWLAVDNSATMLFTLSAGDVKAYLLPAGTTELRKLVADWRTALAHPQGRGLEVPNAGTAAGDEQALARDLFRAAFGPVGATLETGPWDRLVVVADGPLLDAPLAALLTAGGKRLVERFPLSSAVSLHSLVPTSASRPSSTGLLVIADPSEPGKSRAVIPSGERVPPLADARAEAKSIAAQFPGAVNLSGPDAREALVKAKLDCCAILHFATHGILDAADGMDSGLLLAAEPADSTEDGLLQAWEIAAMRLNARLAVLSACDSARGDQRPGEGLVGLAWAFQAAGTPSVVASLWNVNDTATADLMRAFYEVVKSGGRPDDALQKSMLKLHAQASTASPYFWAAFSVIGQAGPIE